MLAAETLCDLGAATCERDASARVVQAIDVVAERLGNTRAVCRACYVHPAVLDAYLDGSLVRLVRAGPGGDAIDAEGALPPEEAAVLDMLRHWTRRTASEPPGPATRRPRAHRRQRVA
jgi:DNA topoisomerase-1